MHRHKNTLQDNIIKICHFCHCRSVHGSERRTNWPIDVPDDRSADGGRRDIQVILIESDNYSKSIKNRTRTRCRTHSEIVLGNIRDAVVLGCDSTDRAGV